MRSSPASSYPMTKTASRDWPQAEDIRRGPVPFAGFGPASRPSRASVPVIIDVAPVTGIRRRAPAPSNPKRFGGTMGCAGGRSGFYRQRRGQTEPCASSLWTCRRFGRKPPCRARRIISLCFRWDCSITPISRPVDRTSRLVPPGNYGIPTRGLKVRCSSSEL